MFVWQPGSTVTVKVLDNVGTADDQPCGPNDVCEKATVDAFTLDCHQGDSFVQATFDIFDDTAYATPGRAVAPMLAADERPAKPEKATLERSGSRCSEPTAPRAPW